MADGAESPADPAKRPDVRVYLEEKVFPILTSGLEELLRRGSVKFFAVAGLEKAIRADLGVALSPRPCPEPELQAVLDRVLAAVALRVDRVHTDQRFVDANPEMRATSSERRCQGDQVRFGVHADGRSVQSFWD